MPDEDNVIEAEFVVGESRGEVHVWAVGVTCVVRADTMPESIAAVDRVLKDAGVENVVKFSVEIDSETYLPIGRKQ